MKVIEEIEKNSSSVATLHEYLENHMNELYDLINNPSYELQNELEEIINYIESKRFIIESLDYSNTQEKAFISILFDICEQYGLICTICIENALQKQGLHLGLRREAAKLFLLQIKENTDYLERFSGICQNLQDAIDWEEDDVKKTIGTFSNYYTKVLRDASIYAPALKEKIISEKENNTYPFLADPFITTILAVDLSDPNTAYEKIKILQTRYLMPVISEGPKYEAETYLIEENTDYEREIRNKSEITISLLRDVAVAYCNKSETVKGRGVKPLLTEKDMFLYMRNYGNMHEAKLKDALNKLPYENISGPLEIIDWGCGQGLATVVFLDYLKQKSNNYTVDKVMLIEPSELTIRRAALHVNVINGTIKIKTICKYFNDIEKTDLSCNDKNIKIHLFSNILDIDEVIYSQARLIANVESICQNQNYFVCVSPYIKDDSADRVDEFKRYFKRKYSSYQSYSEESISKRPEEKYWNCNYRFTNDDLHEYHRSCGCNSKWTKVVRVFSIENMVK